MSEGQNLIGGGPHVEIALAGEIYIMSPVTLLHDIELENHILSLKASPLEAIEKLPPLPQRPKPIIRGKTETAEEYNVRHQAHEAEKANFEHRVAQRNALTTQAFQEATKPRVVTVHDLQHFLQTTEAQFFRLWLSLKKHHPEIQTVTELKQLCQRHEEWCMVHGVEQNMFNIIEEKLKEAAMEEALKNFGGREQPAPETTAVNLDKESHGVGFTQTSVVNTDGQSTTSTS